MSLGEFAYNNAISLKVLTDEHGVKLRTFSDDILKRMAEISTDVRAQAGSGGGLEKRIFESFESTLSQMTKWTNISDAAYLRARQVHASFAETDGRHPRR